MNLLGTGISELVRVAKRTRWRASRLWIRQRMRGAEITLGELGWQQADFPEEVDAEIERIRAVEFDQAQINNESADLSEQLAALGRELDAFREETQAQIARAESERVPLAEAVRISKEKRDCVRTTLAELEDRLAALTKVIPLIDERLAQAATVDIDPTHDDPALLRAESMDLHREWDRLSRDVDSTAAELRAALSEHDWNASGLVEIDGELAKLRQGIRERERSLAAETRRIEAERRQRIRKLTSLDRVKKKHYRLVGRCLAEARIPPMNQPHALEKVLELRKKADLLTSEISDSLAASAEADTSQIWTFYAIVAIATALVGFGCVLLAA